MTAQSICVLLSPSCVNSKPVFSRQQSRQRIAADWANSCVMSACGPSMRTPPVVLAEVFNAILRRKGPVVSQVDMMLAALGRQHKLTILTADRDFEALPDLHVENWITP